MHDKHNLPCWCCDGNSSCSFYASDTPHLYCFKCGKTTFDEEIIEKYMIDTQSNVVVPLSKPQQTQGSSSLFPISGIVAAMDNRAIPLSVADKYKVETIWTKTATPLPYAYAFPSFDVSGKFVGQKVKHFDKRMSWIGDGVSGGMFGQQLFAKGGKVITITEGEEDAMSAYWMLQNGTKCNDPAVVSVKSGAHFAEKECKIHWEYLNSFESIVVAFDGDDVGRAAAKRVAALFPGKAKILNFGECAKDGDKYVWKDANDYLKGAREKDFVSLWFAAEKYAPEGVLPFKSLWDDMTRADTYIQVPFPWSGLNNKLHGLRTGELVVIKAPPKVGKTLICREIAFHLNQTTEYNVGLIFLEETRKRIGLGMCALKLNKYLQHPDAVYTIDELKEAHESLSQGDRLMVFDPEDERTADNVIEKIKYFTKAQDCKFIILDHISMLAYKSGDFDERRFLDKLCADLKDLTNSLNIGIVSVIHVNDDGKTRGSRAPLQLCDAMIALDRDSQNENEKVANTTKVIVEANRITGESGLACKLFFDKTTGRLIETDNDLLFDDEEE